MGQVGLPAARTTRRGTIITAAVNGVKFNVKNSSEKLTVNLLWLHKGTTVYCHGVRTSSTLSQHCCIHAQL